MYQAQREKAMMSASEKSVSSGSASDSVVSAAHLPDVTVLLDRLAQQLLAWAEERQLSAPHLVGIHTGGAWVAEALKARLPASWSLGVLDISFYRDDYTQQGLTPAVKPSVLPLTTEGQHLILVDDVLMTGRTIRAAMNELFDFGRPASICLAALVSLPGRELPIQPDCCALHLELAPDQRIKLSGPSPLELNLVSYPR